MKRLGPTTAGSGPQAYWDAMRALTASAGGFTWEDVADKVPGVVRNTIQSYIAACLRSGDVEVVGEQQTNTCGSNRKRYAVKVNRREAPLEKPGINNGNLGVKQRQLWTTIRAMPSFTTRDLALQASTDDVEISVSLARAYVNALAKAGYLQTVGKAGRFPVLRLLPGKGRGPMLPAVRSDGSVVDRNPRALRMRRVG